MGKRWHSWAPRGTLPKSCAAPSVNIFSAQPCAGAAVAPTATTISVRNRFRMISLPLPQVSWARRGGDSNEAGSAGEDGFTLPLHSLVAYEKDGETPTDEEKQP